MSTFADLVAEIDAALHSYSGVSEVQTYLTADVLDTDTTLPIADSTGTVGIWQIGDELIYVNKLLPGADPAATLQTPPQGRGWRNTTAVAHSSGDTVMCSPTFPRVTIKKAINECLLSLSPTLYQVKTTDYTVDPVSVEYLLPTGTMDVLRVEYLEVGDPSNRWFSINEWNHDKTNPGGNMLVLFGPATPGANLRVVTTAAVGQLVNDADTLADAGIDESWTDLIGYCVASKLIRFLDAKRLQLNTVENVARASVVQAGNAGTIANQMYGMYQQRMAEARRSLLLAYPPTMNFTR